MLGKFSAQSLNSSTMTKESKIENKKNKIASVCCRHPIFTFKFLWRIHHSNHWISVKSAIVRHLDFNHPHNHHWISAKSAGSCIIAGYLHFNGDDGKTDRGRDGMLYCPAFIFVWPTFHEELLMMMRTTMMILSTVIMMESFIVLLSNTFLVRLHFRLNSW